MIAFSVPADFKLNTIDFLSELNKRSEKRVIETYGQVTYGSVLNSGRMLEVLPKVDFTLLGKYIEYSHNKGIEFNYTLNPSCFGNFEFTAEGTQQIHNLLERLHDIGVDSLTVSSPAIVEIVKSGGYNFKIKASAICEISSPGKALFYKNLGVEKIVIDPDITRDFRKIKDICNVFGDGVEIIVNNVCLKNCSYKMFHYNHDSHCTTDTQDVKDYFFNRCAMQKAENLYNPIKLNWIRPEDLHFYVKSGIRHFKIQGRQNVLSGNLAKMLEYYFNEDFDGNLFDLITIFAPYNSFQPYIDNKSLDGFVKRFYDDPGFCRDICYQCRYCESYAQKSMDVAQTENINSKALHFYKEYDKYKKLIIKSNRRRNIIKRLFDNKDLMHDFDLHG